MRSNTIDAVMIRGWMGGLASGCTAFVSSTFAETASTDQTLHLLTGSQRKTRLDKSPKHIAIGNPKIADIPLLKRRSTATSALIIVKEPGVANVMVWVWDNVAAAYNVQVDTAMPVPGDPAMATQSDTTVTSSQPKDVYALARMRRLATAVSGTEKPKDDNVIDTTSVNVPGMVQVDVWVVEFGKMMLREAGFTFGRTHGGFDFRTFAPSSFSKVTFGPNDLSTESAMPTGSAFNLLVSSVSKGLFADLSLLESNGMARVLAEPSLVALSGQSANFLAGGGIPIPVPQTSGTTTIEYKPFSTGLTMSPTIFSENRIVLKMAPEANGLDFSRGVTFNDATVSAIATHRADATAGLGGGESFVTGGLIGRSTLSDADKVPFLDDVLIIGTFFRRLNYNQEKRELVTIIMPYLIKSMARNASVDKTLPGQSSGRGRDTAGDLVRRPSTLGVADPTTMPGFSK